MFEDMHMCAYISVNALFECLVFRCRDSSWGPVCVHCCMYVCMRAMSLTHDITSVQSVFSLLAPPARGQSPK